MIIGAIIVLAGGMGLLALAPALNSPQPRSFDGVTGDAARGEYVLRMAGCVACHTDRKNGGAFLAGGRRLETPFGTFVTPNITPETESGIGSWSLEQFAAAMTDGVSPSGKQYYPAFPYTSYTRMTRQDIADLKAYFDTVPAVANDVPDHDLSILFRWRRTLATWKLLFFKAGEFEPDPGQSDEWNRGAYLVNGPSHCVECHTPRNPLGGFSTDHLAGTSNGPDGDTVPPISPHHHAELAEWTIEDVVFALQVGMKPDGDSVGGAMGEVVDDSTSHMTEADLIAIARYMLSAPPTAP